MPKIGPTRTADELRESAIQTYEGRGSPGLPGVKTDAWLTSANEQFVKNGELAEAIKALVALAKPPKGGKPLFVIGWRIYPNAEHSFFANGGCGCGCACSSHPAKRGNAPASPRGARSLRTASHSSRRGTAAKKRRKT